MCLLKLVAVMWLSSETVSDRMVTNESSDCGVQLSGPASALWSLIRTRVLLAWVRTESYVTEDPRYNLQAATPP